MVCEFAAHWCPHVRRTAVGGRATGTPSLDAVLFTCLIVLWYATPSILLGSSCSAVGTDAWGSGVGLAFGTGCVGCRQVAIIVSCEEQAHTCYTHALARVRIILFWFYFTLFYFILVCFFSELWLSFPVGLFLRFPLHFVCFIFCFIFIFVFICFLIYLFFLCLFLFLFISYFSLPMYFCC